MRFLILAQLWARKNDGATAIEYGLIAAGIAVAISIAVFAIGDDISTIFSDSANAISSAGAP